MAADTIDERGIICNFRKGCYGGMEQYKRLDDSYSWESRSSLAETLAYNFGSTLIYLFPQFTLPLHALINLRDNKNRLE